MRGLPSLVKLVLRVSLQCVTTDIVNGEGFFRGGSLPPVTITNSGLLLQKMSERERIEEISKKVTAIFENNLLIEETGKPFVGTPVC